MNRRGGIGFFFGMVVAIILVAAILGVFVFFSGMFNGYVERTDENVLFGDEAGRDFYDYVDNYDSLAEVRFAVAGENEVDVSIREAGYEG